jgi:hypothetical protein
MKANGQYEWYVRPGVVALGLGAMSLGLGPLLRGHRDYFNYWGGLVFAPFAVLLGSLFILMAIFGWKRFTRLGETPRRRRGENR